MPLSFRLATIFLVLFCFGFGIYKMALGLLGRKIKKIPCIIYLIYYCAASWVQNFILILTDKPESGLLLNLVLTSLHAVVLGLILKRSYHITFIQMLTAGVLGNFIVNTVFNVVDTTAMTYSPVFDGKYLYVLTTIYIPYLSGPLAAVIVSYILKKSNFYRYFSHLFAGRSRAALALAISFALMCVWPVLDFCYPDSTPDAGYAGFFFALIVTALFGVQFLAMYAASQDKIQAQEETIIQQQAHMELLEELQQEIRAFRHDLTNLFSGLTLQAREGDLAGIQEFMKETGHYFDTKLGNEIQQMDGLNNIQPFALRSLLTAKLAYMRNKHIQAVLEVLNPMNPCQMIETEDLLRVVGILLDNAAEAAAGKDGIVRIVFLQEEKELYLAIANNYDTVPDISALICKGYTTKGNGRGTGLSSYRKIISRYRGCVSRTYLKEEMFVQELHIPVV